MTRVTVGVPVYNAASLLEKALQNLADQTHPDFQIVVLDNASTDATGEIAARFAARDARFRYVRQPQNKGALQNFVDVLAMADTPYFLWRAYDDTTDVNFLTALSGLLDRNPQAALAVGRVVLLKRRRRLIVFPVRRRWEPEWAYRVRLLLASRATWIYGMFRTEDLRREMDAVTAGFAHTNGFDHLVLFPLLAQLRVTGTAETTFYQGFVERSDAPRKSDFLDPGMMQRLRDDFLGYCLRRLPQLRRENAARGLTPAVLWLYADRTYRWAKILNARWRMALGGRPAAPTKKYD
jgi:glycosyltransferase involved in cell wall biosynthesis